MNGLRWLVYCCLFTLAKAATFAEVGNLPATVTVPEVVSAEIFLFSVVANPSAATCTISAGDTGSNFNIASESGYWKVTAKSTASFSTASYSLTIQCTNSGVTDSGTLTVNVVQNTAPTVNNLPASISISAKKAATNQVIYAVQSTDTQGDSLTYSLTSTTPASGPFTITSSGFVKVSADLTDTEVASYVLSICVDDPKNQVCSKELTVAITDINHRPVITNLPATYQLPELTSGRLLVYTVLYSDTDSDPASFTIYNNVWVPATANTFFELVEATGEIYLLGGKTLDYETQNTYTFNVVVNDPIHAMNDATHKALTLTILDVNESPYFTGTPAGVSITEGAAGQAVGTPSALCLDPDTAEVLTYIIVPSLTYTSYFTMDSSSAAVVLAQTWDYDSTLPTSVTLAIRCSDPDGAYADAAYTITFTDVNDNDPQCSPSTTSLSLSWQTEASVTLLSLQCTDIDSGVNAALLYSPAGIGYGSTYFESDSSGNIAIKTVFTMEFNTDFTVTFIVTDQGSTARTATVTISVTYTERPTYITYDEVDACFLCTTTAVSLISGVGLVVVGFLTVGIVLCLLKCCYDCERGAIQKVLIDFKKNTKQICDCCRPTKLQEDKAEEEIKWMKNTDAEYMRQRDQMRRETGSTITDNTLSESTYLKR